MYDLEFWLGAINTLLDASTPCTIMLSFACRYLLGLLVRYLSGLVVDFKVVRRWRRYKNKSWLTHVIVIVLFGRLTMEFVVWLK